LNRPLKHIHIFHSRKVITEGCPKHNIADYIASATIKARKPAKEENYSHELTQIFTN